MKANIKKHSFDGGEVSRDLRGRSNGQFYLKSVERMENFIPTPQGPAKYRTSLRHVSQIHTSENGESRGISFQPSNDNGMYLVWERGFFQAYNTEGRMDRAYPSGGTGSKTSDTKYKFTFPMGYAVWVGAYVEAKIEITNIITSEVSIIKVRGDIITSNSVGGGYEIEVYDNRNIDIPGGSTFTVLEAYQLIGAWDKLGQWDYDPYDIDYVQIENSIYIVRPNYANLIVFTWSGTDFSVSTQTINVTYEPSFWGTKPAETIEFCTAIAFYEQRLIVAKENKIYFSKTNRFTDFAQGTNASDGMAYTIAGSNNNVNDILWIEATESYLMIGTDKGTFKAQGGTAGAPITPNSISINPIDSIGVKKANVIYTDQRLYYVERGGRTLRALEYYDTRNGYRTIDVNKLAKDMTWDKIKNISFTQGEPNIVFCVLENGDAIGMVTDAEENMIAWFRLPMSGDDRLIDIGTIFNTDQGDILMAIIERHDGSGNKSRHVEFLEKEIEYPPLENFLITGSREGDLFLYNDYIKTQQENDLRLDSKYIFNPVLGPSQFGVNTNNDEVFYEGTFLPGEGKVKLNDIIVEIDGTGEGLISSNFNNEYVITIASPFSKTVFSKGELAIKRNAHSLERFKSREVVVACENRVKALTLDENGVLDLSEFSENIKDVTSIYNIGLRYKGLIKTLPLESASELGDSSFKLKNLTGLFIDVLSSLGFKYGTDLYDLEEVLLREPSDNLFETVPYHSGVIGPLMVDDMSERHKSLYFVQDKPYPCNIVSYGYYAKTEEL